MTKPTKWPVHPAKTLISLGICPVWSESSLCTQWVAKDSVFLHADSKDSDQSRWMPRLIWVFSGCKAYFVGFVMRWLNIFCLMVYGIAHGLNSQWWINAMWNDSKTSIFVKNTQKTPVMICHGSWNLWVVAGLVWLPLPLWRSLVQNCWFNPNQIQSCL